MAAINLDSLSTFWASIKAYLLQKFSDETVLWSGSSTTASLSETIDNYKEIRIDYKGNDNSGFSKTFQTANTTGGYIVLDHYHVNTASTVRAYIKNSLFALNVARDTLTWLKSVQTNVNATATSTSSNTSTSATTLVRVVGIHKITS